MHLRRGSLRRHLFIGFLWAIALSIVLLGSVHLLVSVLHTVRSREATLTESAEAIAQLVGAYIEGNRRGIVELAVAVEEIGGTDRSRLERRLQEFHRRSPEILTLLITDDKGWVIADERQLALGGGPRPGGGQRSVADREYFREPRDTGRSYIAEAFLGRGFGQDPIVALAAPWTAPDGSFAGVVEGSLDLDRLGEVGALFQRLPKLEIFMVDGRSQLLWTGTGRQGSPLDLVVIDRQGARLAGEPASRVLLGRSDVPGTRWSIVVQQPLGAIYRSAIPQVWITLAWMAAVFVPASLLAHYLSRRITRPLEEVTASLDHIELGAAPPAPVPLRNDAPREVATIVYSTGRLLDRLQASYADLSRVLAEREATIEEEIERRTHVERFKEDFVSVVSHELRTPLTSIHGSLSLILGGVAGELPEKARTLAEIAARNSEHLVRLVNDILDIEKIESGTMAFSPVQVELMPLIAQAVESNRAYAQQYEVDLRLVSSGVDGVTIRADTDRIQQVLANLLSNAARYSPRGGVIEIGVRNNGGSVRISVTDQGPGIPVDFQPYIFEKFAQADVSSARQKGGTGLGLNISKAIIERHGGRLWFETEPGVRTTFSFELPVAEP
jgi:signal transduction histidine kinase